VFLCRNLIFGINAIYFDQNNSVIIRVAEIQPSKHPYTYYTYYAYYTYYTYYTYNTDGPHAGCAQQTQPKLIWPSRQGREAQHHDPGSIPTRVRAGAMPLQTTKHAPCLFFCFGEFIVKGNKQHSLSLPTSHSLSRRLHLTKTTL